MHIRTTIVATVASLSFTATGLTQTVRDFLVENKVFSSQGTTNDNAGGSVSISGDTVLMGGYGDDDNGSNSGSACFYQQQSDGSWLEIQKIIAPDGAPSDRFGGSVSISGDTALVGAALHTHNLDRAGSAYIYERDADGVWTITAKLFTQSGEDYDYFGGSVAISGDTAVVGAYGTGTNGSDSGIAYIYERGTNGWNTYPSHEIIPSDGEPDNVFGYSVAISDDTALVGAVGDNDNGTNSGSAYIFERQADGSWSETAKLTASDGAASDEFGASVAISGDTALVSGWRDDDNGTNSGSVYIYERQADGSWSETGKLTASDGTAYDAFGLSIAIDGDTVVAGAYVNDDNGTNSGKAYLYQRQTDGSWSEYLPISASDAEASAFFGTSVAIDGHTFVIGADGINQNSGGAYIYDIYSVINLDQEDRRYKSLEAAIRQAAPDERLAVRSSAFEHDGIMDASDVALQFIAAEPITMGTDLMFLPADGSSFTDSGDVEEAEYLLSGKLIAPAGGELILSSMECLEGSQLLQNGCALYANESFTTTGGVAYLEGDLLAEGVVTGIDGANLIGGDTRIFSDYVNDGTTAVHRGTLYIFGDLSGEGTMLGNVDTGPGGVIPPPPPVTEPPLPLLGGDLPSPGDGFAIGGSSTLGPKASLRMLDFDWTLGIGGDVDWAIDDPSRFAMSGATLSLTGLDTGLQSLEVMSPDQGAVETTDFELGTLRVESGTVVTLVDTHDNAGDGDAACEAIYADTIVVEVGGTLLTNGCPVYARETSIKGELDGDVIIIGESCQGDEDGDGIVDVLDLLAVISAWGACDKDCSADFDSNGTVDVIDLLIVIQYWGACGD